MGDQKYVGFSVRKLKRVHDVVQAFEVIASERRDGSPVGGDLRRGVYIVMRAPTPCVECCYIEYGLKTDSTGKYSALYRPYHRIGLELGISAASAALRGEPTGNGLYFLDA